MKMKRTKNRVQVEEITLTPTMAKKVLEQSANPRNRGRMAAVIRTYAADMSAGRWVLSPHGLVFGPDGMLLDGHHRCAAVVESGASVPMMSTTFDDPRDAEAALHAIDRGKGRRTGHVLELLGHIEPGRGTKVDAMVRAIDLLETGGNGNTTSADVVLLGYMRMKAAIDWAIDVLPGREYATPVSAAMAYAYRAFPAQVEEFAKLVTEKAGLVAGSAAHRFVQTTARLRDEHNSRKTAEIGGKGGSEARRAAMLITLRAIVGHVRGETMHRLYPTDEGKSFIDAAIAKQAKKKAA